MSHSAAETEAQTEISRSELEALDARDPLAPVRERFLLPEGVLYFDGNSLGPLTRAAGERLRRVEYEWRLDLVSSWNRHDWIDLPRRVGAKIAPLVGARKKDVVVCDSVSVNLFKLMAAAVGHGAPGRRRIAVQGDHFPTDVYLADGLAGLLAGPGTGVRMGDTGDAVRLGPEDLERLEAGDSSVVGPDVAVVSLGHVDFRTGRLFDMAAMTRAVHEAGALALWDLSHSAGALPVDLAGAGVDLAVGCGYKYLNGGPGAPSFLYAAPALQASLRTPLPGWLGHADPFAFSGHYEPAEGVQRFVCGTPPILSLAALDAALEVWRGVSMADVRRKSLALGDAFQQLSARCLAPFGVENASPTEHALRGSQVSLRHPDAYAVMQALIDRGVVGDFRAPNLLRFGFCPLFLRHTDVWDAVETLRDVLASGAHQQERYRRRSRVT